MRLAYFPLDKPTEVQVKLPNGGLVKVDLNKELAIHYDRLRDELISQPARYATWSTVTEIARMRVKNSKVAFFKLNDREEHHTTVDRHEELYEEYNFLNHTKEAFSHKKDALIKLLSGGDSHKVIQEYHKNLSDLRALLRHRA